MTTSLYEQLQSTLSGAYRLERELGGGGMSRVFLAHELALGRKVVVKVLLPELAAGVSVERFRREIQLAAQLQHPHIVPLLSAGESGGLPYFTMPFITGESLRLKLTREGELPVGETARILRDVVSALAYAHADGVVHRDIKPDNVLLSGGVAVVTDFGVAKAVSASADVPADTRLTSVGVALGTPAYMAPEQATCDPQIDHRADIYALGVMAYEMLTGGPPFAGRSAQAILAAHVVEAPEPVERRRPAIPPMLAALVMACLAKRPADRPQSAADVLHVLDAIGTPTGGTARTAAIAPQARGAAGGRRSWRSVAIWAAVAGTVVLAAAGVLSRRNESPSAAAPVPGAPQPAKVEATAPVTDSTATPLPQAEQTASRDVSPGSAARKAQRPESARPRPRRSTSPREQTLPAPAVPAAPPTDTAVATRSSPAPSTPATPPTQQESIAAPPPAVAPQPPPVPAPADTTAATPPPATPSIRAPKPAPVSRPAAVDPRPEIRSVIADYAAAVESQNVGNIRRVYPAVTPVQQRGWEQFFQAVREVKAQLAVAGLDVSGTTAEARVNGAYTYRNTSTRRLEQQPVSFRATLHRDAAGWRISQIR